MKTCSLSMLIMLTASGPLSAQTPAQKVSPPVAQAWIDVATFSGMGMPMGMGGGANPMASIGSLFGGGGGGAAQGNAFGNTQSASAGRFVDVTLLTRNNPSLAEAQQAVPAGFLSPALKLQAPPPGKPVPESDEEVVPQEMERPRGRILLYWGCGATVRAGQPVVLDAASATAADFARVFQSRRATQRGTHSAAGDDRCGRARPTAAWCRPARRWPASMLSAAVACRRASGSRFRRHRI